MEFFGVGIGEAGLILVVLLIVVGPQRFPEIARQAGKWYRLARSYADEVMGDVRTAMDDLESEVGAPGEELHAIREIGRELTQIGGETRDAAASAQSPPEPPPPERPR